MSFVFPPPPPVSVQVMGRPERFAVRRVYCVGRNYEEHAKEMGFTDTESSQFTDVIKQIYGATSLEGPGGHGPRGPGGQQDGRRGSEGH